MHGVLTAGKQSAGLANAQLQPRRLSISPAAVGCKLMVGRPFRVVRASGSPSKTCCKLTLVLHEVLAEAPNVVPVLTGNDRPNFAGSLETGIVFHVAASSINSSGVTRVGT